MIGEEVTSHLDVARSTVAILGVTDSPCSVFESILIRICHL